MTPTRSISLGRPHGRRLRMTGVAVAVVALLLLGAASPAGAIGELDTTFSGDGRQTTNLTPSFDIGFAAAVQEDGKILAAGLGARRPHVRGPLQPRWDPGHVVQRGRSGLRRLRAGGRRRL